MFIFLGSSHGEKNCHEKFVSSVVPSSVDFSYKFVAMKKTKNITESMNAGI